MTNKIYQLSEIKEMITPIAQKYGAERIYLFGSYARGNPTEKSDIDLRISRGEIKSLLQMSGLYLDLEEKLNKKIDIVTTESLEQNLNNPLTIDFVNEISKEEVLIYDNK